MSCVQNLGVCAALGPACRQLEFFGMHTIRPSMAKCIDRPLDGTVSLGGAGETLTDRTGQIVEVLFERRGTHGTLDDRRGHFRA